MNKEYLAGGGVSSSCDGQRVSAGSHDLEPFRPDLAELELTEEQETELLETLWSIMASFVRLGFDVKICEQIVDTDYILPAPQCVDVESADASRPKNETGGLAPQEGRHDERR